MILLEINYEFQTQNNGLMTEKTIPHQYFNGIKEGNQLSINAFKALSLTVFLLMEQGCIHVFFLHFSLKL